jgi:hypothetical protein
VVEKIWSTGGDKLEDILRWPAKRVEGIYKAIITREAVESIEAQRRDMIAACYANPNWDGKENADKRSEYLKDINRHFNAAITAIYHPDGPREQDVDWSNPFFAAHKREIARTKEIFTEMQGRTVGDVIDDEDKSSGNGRARLQELELDQIPRNT